MSCEPSHHHTQFRQTIVVVCLRLVASFIRPGHFFLYPAWLVGWYNFDPVSPGLYRNFFFLTSFISISLIFYHLSSHIREDCPKNQASRWSSNTNSPPQFITLKLHQPAIIKKIHFGKYEKPHVCNLRKFKVVGGLEEEHMVTLFEGYGLFFFLLNLFAIYWSIEYWITELICYSFQIA